MIYKKHIILLLIIVLFSNCKKDDNEDSFMISIVSTSPLEIESFKRILW